MPPKAPTALLQRAGRRLALAALAVWGAAGTAADAPVTLRIVGGLAGVNQYTLHEEPFWTRELPRLSGGRYNAEIVPFDRAGIRGTEMLRLLQLGVVPFGTMLVSLVATDAPLLGAIDLAGLSPDVPALRRNLMAIRPRLAQTLRERHGVELLAVYMYPAQMLFCKQPIQSLEGISKRRVRTSSATQADWVEALGGQPVTTPFAEIVAQLRSGAIDCAITGSMSGNNIGLHEVTSHLYSLPVNWGVSLFAANAVAWQALPPDLRTLLRQSLQQLELAVWRQSEQDTGAGVACNTGTDGCEGGRPGRMTEVRPGAADRQRQRKVFTDVVLSRWVERCGPGCIEAWNQTLGPVNGIQVRPPH